ncbi:MAG: extensin family protein [Novosphingobium sp.]|jgi:hypothetical protein
MKRLACLLMFAAALAGCSVLPESRGGSARQDVRRSTSTFASGPEARQCLAELGRTNANFTPVPDRYLGDGCSTLNSVTLSALRSDDAQLSLVNLGPVACPLANDFAAWARYGVDRAARQILGSPVVRIETMGSYACRNVAGTGRRSAHATANAIDVSAFILADGRRVSIIRDWTDGTDAEQRFLRIVHASACKRFGTVLGPEYNAAHRDHLHVESGGGNFCR